jgi:DNA-directed RNA polymerase specialized sigma24 family protein
MTSPPAKSLPKLAASDKKVEWASDRSRFGNDCGEQLFISRLVRAEVVSHDDSVTRWIAGVQTGDDADIHRLWSRYFQRLVRLAGTRLPKHCRRAFDEEDVALSAFQSFCERAEGGQFPQLSDRHDLWRLLATLTIRKAIMTIRHQGRQKRGGGHVLGESALMGPADAEGQGMAEFLSREPTPDEAARFCEQYDQLLASLEHPTLKTIAMRKLDGYSSEEIAGELGITSRTVDRKLQLIRTVWEREIPA